VGYKAKKAVVRAVLSALGAGFEVVSKRNAELKAEIADWEDGRVISVGVLPDGPAIALKKEGDRIRYLGKGDHNPTLKVLFKNVDAAFLPLAFQMGAHTAFAQHRAILHGNVAKAMQTTRAMAIVQTYITPGFILRKITKRPPRLTAAQCLFKARVLATLPIALAVNMRK